MSDKPLVILNPGHHKPEDPGACGNGLQEADLTVDICGRIQTYLPAYAINSIIVHSNDLNKICNLANRHPNASLFVAVHVNAGGGTGFEDYIYPGSEKADSLRKLLHYELAGFYSRNGFRDRGMKTANFAVLRETNMPAILTENLFIDNPADAAKLKDDSFLAGIAQAHAKGIARALGYCYKGQQLPASSIDSTAEAIKFLQDAGVISSPNYWLANARPGKIVDGDFAAALIQKAAKKLKG